MAYVPSDQVAKVTALVGETKLIANNTEVYVKAYMAGALLGLAAVFAVTISYQTGIPIVGAIIFPVGFVLIYLLGYDLLTGVFVLTPLACAANPGKFTVSQVVGHWGKVFIGNFAGAATVAVLTISVFTHGYSTEPNAVGEVIANIGVSRTVGYKDHGAGGMLTIFIRGVLCNWMISVGVVGSMVSTSVTGKVLTMWLPIMLFFGMGFEHSIVNMYLFPTALMVGGDFSIMDYLIWNEIPVILGNLVGGIFFTALPMWLIYIRVPKANVVETAYTSNN